MKLKHLLAGALCCACSFAQNIQRTQLANTISSTSATQVYVYSTVIPASLGQGYIYIDSEAMQVAQSAFAPSALNNLVLLTVKRGILGTNPATHAAGAVAFYGNPGQFVAADLSGGCNSAGPQYLNVSDQMIFSCGPTSQWVGITTILSTGGGGGSPIWGQITGTLSNQGDLQTALNGKQTTGNYPVAPGSTTIGFIPTWTSSTGATIGVGLQETGTGTRLVSASAVGTSGNCAQWLSGNLTDSGSPCGSGGGSVTWPATGDLVLSTSTSSPGGLAPINGDCVIGSGGAWVAGSCSGGSFTLPNGVLASRPTSPASPTLYLATDQPGLQQLDTWDGTNWNQLINIDASGLKITGGTLGIDGTIIPCLSCANVLTATQIEPAGFKIAPVIVASLPSAASIAGTMRTVSDALTPTAGGTIVGGGALFRPVISDGTNWKSLY